MKKEKILISLTFIIILLILMSVIYLSNNRSFEILVDNNNNCDQKKYYFNYGNKEVYIDCLEDISIKKKGKTYDLKNAIDNNVVSFEEILKSSDEKFEYWDGGSVLYKFKDFSIIDYQRNLANNKQCNYIVSSNKNINVNDYCY